MWVWVCKHFVMMETVTLMFIHNFISVRCVSKLCFKIVFWRCVIFLNIGLLLEQKLPKRPLFVSLVCSQDISGNNKCLLCLEFDLCCMFSWSVFDYNDKSVLLKLLWLVLTDSCTLTRSNNYTAISGFTVLASQAILDHKFDHHKNMSRQWQLHRSHHRLIKQIFTLYFFSSCSSFWKGRVKLLFRFIAFGKDSFKNNVTKYWAPYWILGGA